MEKRTLEAAYKFYCAKELENAHSAQADILATYEVLKAQIGRYPELKNDVDSLSEFSSHNQNVDFAGRIVYDEKGAETFNFGKYKGKPVKEVFDKDPSYYAWMMNGDFPLYTKNVLTALYIQFKQNK
jgi:DNA polymerase-3 subunit epsilon